MPSNNLPPRADPQVHVVPGRKGVWSVRATDAASAVSLHSSLTDAGHAAHCYAHTCGATEVVVHDPFLKLRLTLVRSARVRVAKDKIILRVVDGPL